MSAIVGIVRWDGPVESAVLDRMADRAARRDASGVVQRLGDDLTSAALVWDGRLDNRDELLAMLRADDETRHDSPDAAIVYRAYRRWGGECVERMIGDFAFAIWDAETRTLVCGRDRLGLKPLHYTWRGGSFCFASEITPLIAARDTAPEPDDEIVLAFLLREFRPRDDHRTLLRDIHRLPPGHVLVARDRRLTIRRYWSIDPERRIRYASEDEYVDHFSALFRDAVACRLRTDAPVGAFLSGGLDSAAIVCTAERIFTQRGIGSPPLEALTLYMDDGHSDERRYARAVAAAAGFKLHEVHGAGEHLLRGLTEHIGEAQSPIVGANHESTLAMFAAARDSGCRVVLSGEGGDQLVDENGYLGDLLRIGRPLRFLRELRALGAWYGGGTFDLAGDVASMVLSTHVKYRIKRLLRRAPPPWINTRVAETVGLRDRLREPRHAVPFPSLAQWDTYLSITSPYYVLKLEVEDRIAARFGIELRYPFLDSRLVEFMLAVPWECRTRDGERKRLVHRAMQGIVPDTVLSRRGKGDWADGMDAGLTALCRLPVPGPLENRSGLVDRYVDRPGAERLVAAYLRGAHDLRWEIWFLVTLDRWLELLTRGGSR